MFRCFSVKIVSSKNFKIFCLYYGQLYVEIREAIVAVTGGKLDFETWEQIFYGEFDGMRNKRVLVKIIGE